MDNSDEYDDSISLFDIPEFMQLPMEQQDFVIPPGWVSLAECYTENDADEEEIVVTIATSPLPWRPPTPSLESSSLSSPAPSTVGLSGPPPPSNKEPRKGSSKKNSRRIPYNPKYLKDPTDPNLTAKERASILKSKMCRQQRIKKVEEVERLKALNEQLVRENSQLKAENRELKDAQRRDKAVAEARSAEMK